MTGNDFMSSQHQQAPPPETREERPPAAAVHPLLNVSLTAYHGPDDRLFSPGYRARVFEQLPVRAIEPRPAKPKHAKKGAASPATARPAAAAGGASGEEEEEEAVLRPLRATPPLDMEQWPRFKWLLHLDGHSAAYRLQYLLATNSAVFKQGSPYYEYYYSGLRPHEHYYPFWESHPTDVLDALRNASEHDESTRRTARRAQSFAHRHLSPHARQCYWRALLSMYARRLHSTPTLSDWPRARPLFPGGRHSRRAPLHGGELVDWRGVSAEWRAANDASLRATVAELEDELAQTSTRAHAAARSAQDARTAERRGGGSSSHGRPRRHSAPFSRLESEAEKRTPRLDVERFTVPRCGLVNVKCRTLWGRDV